MCADIQAEPIAVTDDEAAIIIRVPVGQVGELQTMLREQIAGDQEQLRWLRDNPGADRRNASHLTIPHVHARLTLCWALAEAVGGLF